MRSNARRLVGLGRSHDAEPFLKNHKRFLSRQNQVFPISLHTLMQMKSRNDRMYTLRFATVYSNLFFFT